MPRQIVEVKGGSVVVSEQIRFEREQLPEDVTAAHREVLVCEELRPGRVVSPTSQTVVGDWPGREQRQGRGWGGCDVRAR